MFVLNAGKNILTEENSALNAAVKLKKKWLKKKEVN